VLLRVNRLPLQLLPCGRAAVATATATAVVSATQLAEIPNIPGMFLLQSESQEPSGVPKDMTSRSLIDCHCRWCVLPQAPPKVAS